MDKSFNCYVFPFNPNQNDNSGGGNGTFSRPLSIYNAFILEVGRTVISQKWKVFT